MRIAKTVLKNLLIGVIGMSGLSSFCGAAEEGWDAQAGLSLRNYPLGASVSGTVGYGYELWRSSSESGGPEWKYGYIRPSVKLQSSGVVNGATAEVEVFPISIFGFALGQNLSGRNLKPSDDFDCLTTHCGGRLQRSYLRTQAIAAMGSSF